MRTIAYLCSRDTLPGPDRRGDAFEHDRSVAALAPAFAAEGLELLPCAWDLPLPEGVVAALIGTAWDYWERLEPFLWALDSLPVPLHNDARIVRWNADKRYLASLERAGVPSVPTVWLDDPTPAAVAAAFHSLGTDDLVVKRQVGAGAYQQHRLRAGDPVPPMPAPMLAQPFLPGIQHTGETSLIYIDGALSHGLRKRAAAGDYRIQSLYGGTEVPHAATEAERAVAAQALGALDRVPLYARVDLVPHDGTPRLIELELIEPYLYPLQGPELGPRLARALAVRLGQ